MGCSDQDENTRRETEMNLGGCKQNRLENYKNVGGRKKKKQPQRGMGVAQLERLRLQARWKKMTEINVNPHLSISLQNPHQFLPSSTATYGGVGFRNIAPHYNQFSMLVQARENHGPAVGGVGPLFSDHFLIDPSGIGSSNLGFRVGNVNETSKQELSSIPNNVMKCSPDGCGVYHKKKRINGENMGCNGERNMYEEMSPVNPFGNFKGNNVGDLIVDGGNQYFGSKAGRCREQEPEVMAVHGKKGSSGGLLMEYEFFPGKLARSGNYQSTTNPSNYNPFLAYYNTISTSESSLIPSSVGAAAVTTNTDQAVDASNSIDLSLKLSY